MTIAEALRASSDEAQWSPAKIAAACGVSETTARRWMDGKAVPSGDKMVILQRDLHGFAEKLGLKGSSRRHGGPRSVGV